MMLLTKCVATSETVNLTFAPCCLRYFASSLHLLNMNNVRVMIMLLHILIIKTSLVEYLECLLRSYGLIE